MLTGWPKIYVWAICMLAFLSPISGMAALNNSSNIAEPDIENEPMPIASDNTSPVVGIDAVNPTAGIDNESPNSIKGRKALLNEPIIQTALSEASTADLSGLGWQRCLGGSDKDYASSIQKTSDGGYIISSYSKSNDGNVRGNHGSYDFWVIKLDSGGVIQWQKCLGGSDEDYATSVQQTSDGGYVVAGKTGSNDGDLLVNNVQPIIDGIGPNQGLNDAWVVKLSSDGDIQWQNCLGGSSFDSANSIQQISDGGYIIAGDTSSNNGNVSGNHGSYDAWIIKLNSTGSVEWQKCMGGSGKDVANSIQQTSDAGYIVAGYTESNDGNVSGNHGGVYADFWVVKLNSSGIQEWQKCLGGSSDDKASSILRTSDGGYIVAGDTYSNDGNVSGNHGDGNYSDFWVAKLNSSGSLEWQKCLGGSGPDKANSIEQTPDGGYIIAGETRSNDGNVSGWHSGYDQYGYPLPDFWVVKLSPRRGIQMQKCLGGSYSDQANSISLTKNGGYIVAGFTQSNDGNVFGNHMGGDSWVTNMLVDGIGTLRWGPVDSTFYIDLNANGKWDPSDISFNFGLKSDKPIAGDWNGDGKDEIGVFRPFTHIFYLDSNGNYALDADDLSFNFGLSTDIPISGDWNGDGIWEVGVFRPSKHIFYLDSNGNRVLQTNDTSFSFGTSTDLPISGDWNGDGKWEVGIFRPSKQTFYLDSNGNKVLGKEDVPFIFGLTTDTPISGDWNGDGKWEVGTFSSSTFAFKLDCNGNDAFDADDLSFNFGAAGDLPVAGRW